MKYWLRGSTRMLAAVLVLLLLESGSVAVAGTGTIHADAAPSVTRYRARPSSRCDARLDGTSVVLRCRNPGGRAVARFTINVGDGSVTDVDTHFGTGNCSASAVWAFRADQTVRVVVRASGTFRCEIQMFMVTVDT
jgi:hypothetical protein